MNSTLMDFVYTFMNPEKGEALAEVKKYHVEQLPILVPDPKDHAAKPVVDRLTDLVSQMLELNTRLRASRTDPEKTILRRQIEAVDRQIDQFVYQLYGLTDDEIALVESSSQPPGPTS